MASTKIYTEPQQLKNKAASREEFFASKKPGERISGDDLYWILQRCAQEGSSEDDFINRVESLLDQQLGQNNYAMGISLNDGSSGGRIDAHGNKLPSTLIWGGAAGVLGGCVSKCGVSIFVFQ